MPPAVLSNRAERDRLVSAFETLRNKFFPRWDKTGLWKCRVDRRRVGDGICCLATKTIYINPGAENLMVTLIHEICHALAPRMNHGGGWQQRMEKVASRAEQLGELSLAASLRSEVTQYRFRVDRVTARAIYTEIEESPVNRSFELIVGTLARKYLMNRREFLKRFRGAKQACKEGRRLPACARTVCELTFAFSAGTVLPSSTSTFDRRRDRNFGVNSH
jgi:hypothetical protein